MPPLFRPSTQDAAQALIVPLPEGHGQAPAQNLKDLIGGDEGARCEAGGQIGRGAPESREAMRTSFRLGGRWDAPCRICGFCIYAPL